MSKELTSREEILRCDNALRIAKLALEKDGKKELADRLYERLLLDEISINQYFEVALNALTDEGLKSTVEHAWDNLELFA